MMSDQEIGKKELESIQLGYFLEAYEHATGATLAPVVPGLESPDFAVVNENGEVLGVELTKVMRSPDEQFVSRIIDLQQEPDPYDQLEQIHHLIGKKEEARLKRYVDKFDETILVIELVDGSLSNFMHLLEGLKSEYSHHGFMEVWLADFSAIDAYGNVELFCLYPQHKWGYFPRPNAGSKPYG